jgi:hypothetical protein
MLRPPLRALDAKALARSVFPVPGGPWNRTPRGGVRLKRWNSSGYKSGSRVISFSAEISIIDYQDDHCQVGENNDIRSSKPPTESKVTLGLTPSGSASANALKGQRLNHNIHPNPKVQLT